MMLGNHQRKKKQIIVGLLIGSAMAACQSKFEESVSSGLQPDAVGKKEYSLKVENSRKRISQVQDILHGLNLVVSKFKIQSGKEVLVSNLIEQILEVTNSSQGVKTEKGYTSEGEFFVNLPGLEEECRVIKARSIYAENKEKISHEIAVQTCKTKGEFQKIFEIQVTDEKVSSIIPVQNIESILPEIDMNEMLAVQGCQVEKGKETISKISCKSGDWILNNRERIRFSQIQYQSSYSAVFVAKGQLLLDGSAKKNVSLEIDPNGKPTFKASDITPE